VGSGRWSSSRSPDRRGAPIAGEGGATERGALARGKVADVVVWSGDPLEASTNAETVIIGGGVPSPATHQTKLRDRYGGVATSMLAPAAPLAAMAPLALTPPAPPLPPSAWTHGDVLITGTGPT